MHDTLILVVRRARSAYKQPSQSTTALFRSSLETWCHSIGAQNAAFASELLESDWGERTCCI